MLPKVKECWMGNELDIIRGFAAFMPQNAELGVASLAEDQFQRRFFAVIFVAVIDRCDTKCQLVKNFGHG